MYLRLMTLTFWPQNNWLSRTHRREFLCHVWWFYLHRPFQHHPRINLSTYGGWAFAFADQRHGTVYRTIWRTPVFLVLFPLPSLDFLLFSVPAHSARLRCFIKMRYISSQLLLLFSPRKRGSVFLPALVLCVCPSVCLWTWTDLYQILWEGS